MNEEALDGFPPYRFAMIALALAAVCCVPRRRARRRTDALSGVVRDAHRRRRPRGHGHGHQPGDRRHADRRRPAPTGATRVAVPAGVYTVDGRRSRASAGRPARTSRSGPPARPRTSRWSRAARGGGHGHRHDARAEPGRRALLRRRAHRGRAARARRRRHRGRGRERGRASRVQNLGPGQSQVAMRGVSAGQIVRDQPGVKEQVGAYLDDSVISLSLFTPGHRPVRHVARRGAARPAGHAVRLRLALRHGALHHQPARARRARSTFGEVGRQHDRRRQRGRQRQAGRQRAARRHGRAARGRRTTTASAATSTPCSPT